jgi:hypothetical protein
VNVIALIIVGFAIGADIPAYVAARRKRLGDFPSARVTYLPSGACRAVPLDGRCEFDSCAICGAEK